MGNCLPSSLQYKYQRWRHPNTRLHSSSGRAGGGGRRGVSGGGGGGGGGARGGGAAGSAPLRCQCGQTFRLRSHLQTHIRTKHGKLERPPPPPRESRPGTGEDESSRLVAGGDRGYGGTGRTEKRGRLGKMRSGAKSLWKKVRRKK